MMMGIRDILIISSPEDIPRFRSLLGKGFKWGINLSFKVQEKPNGIAQALILGESFLKSDPKIGAFQLALRRTAILTLPL